MPVIDLDSRAPVSPTTRGRHPRLLIIVAAFVVLLGVPGEAGHLPSVFDDFCGYLAATGQSGRKSVVLIDTVSGEITQQTTVTGACPTGP
ncbi:hypothetical protein Aab01nite_26910 [Paractinoplanes abujensis]|uniref:Uncharacterized protein n=1 Tax=Paractinoplanes abujensis TaxID=882441 RepID=A0A7W7D152_9ACTN|nr:hypothetical protein [Actinoplanes abujensis]MBB4698414.1 hypothetical protein [Actinoplanes abujensis]GID19101.1 hypothetical protein Aab01nite_26910 [Actinoplanes abujensis]